MQRYFWLVGGATGVTAADLISKSWAAANLSQPVELLPFLSFSLSWNAGIAFGLPLPSWLIIGASGIILVLLVWFFSRQIRAESRLGTVAFALILGGAVGNLAERVLSGQVTDFIQLWLIPNFNLADTAITLGVSLLIIFNSKIFRSHD